jgi:hypothetical protein
MTEKLDMEKIEEFWKNKLKEFSVKNNEERIIQLEKSMLRNALLLEILERNQKLLLSEVKETLKKLEVNPDLLRELIKDVEDLINKKTKDELK